MNQIKAKITSKPDKRLQSFVTRDKTLIQQAQRLRYQVFATEMGASLHSHVEGLDVDIIDQYCDHLIVFDTIKEKIVGYTRILNDEQAKLLGYFYSQNEFNLGQLISLPGRFMEIGRTCVAPDSRGSVVLMTLWSALAIYAQQGGYDYLIGCASIPPGPSGFSVDAVYRNIAAKNHAPETLCVTPLVPVPEHMRCLQDESGIPPLVKAYLRFGVLVCGQPCWDAEFNVMDLFILLPIHKLEQRYTRHYIKPENVTRQLQTEATL